MREFDKQYSEEEAQAYVPGGFGSERVGGFVQAVNSSGQEGDTYFATEDTLYRIGCGRSLPCAANPPESHVCAAVRPANSVLPRGKNIICGIYYLTRKIDPIAPIATEVRTDIPG